MHSDAQRFEGVDDALRPHSWRDAPARRLLQQIIMTPWVGDDGRLLILETILKDMALPTACQHAVMPVQIVVSVLAHRLDVPIEDPNYELDLYAFDKEATSEDVHIKDRLGEMLGMLQASLC